MIEAGIRRYLTQKAKKITKLAVKRPVLTFKLSIIVFGLVFIVIGILANQKTEAETLDSASVLGVTSEQSPEDFVELSRPTFTVQSITIAEERKIEEIERLEAIKKAAAEKAEHVNRINAFLTKQHSPVANTAIAGMLYDYYKSTGTDYKILLAISGVESGFCNASFNYNCFGYLNGAKYSSYENAFTDLIPKVGSQYAAKYGTNFEALAKAYGMLNENCPEYLRGYYNSI